MWIEALQTAGTPCLRSDRGERHLFRGWSSRVVLASQKNSTALLVVVSLARPNVAMVLHLQLV